jgi:hypothetical protein
LAYVDGVHVLGEKIDTVGKNTEALLKANKEVCLDVNAEKTSHTLT